MKKSQKRQSKPANRAAAKRRDRTHARPRPQADAAEQSSDSSAPSDPSAPPTIDPVAIPLGDNFDLLIAPAGHAGMSIVLRQFGAVLASIGYDVHPTNLRRVVTAVVLVDDRSYALAQVDREPGPSLGVLDRAGLLRQFRLVSDL
jgi:hypothetical protein